MANEKHTAQQLGRTENLIENHATVGVDDDVDVSCLEARIAAASPLPWVHVEGGRIVSVPIARQWDGAERMPDNDPRWSTLDDPTIAYVIPSANGRGQGDRDAALIADACSALPKILKQLRRLTRERADHMRTLRKDIPAVDVENSAARTGG